MARILALYYSLTHQNERVMTEICQMLERGGHEVTLEPIRPQPAYPLPANPAQLGLLLKQAVTGTWPIVDLEPLQADLSAPYDLVLIGYQPWYMTPSVPIHSLINGAHGAFLQGKSVIGIITCRAMFARASGLFQSWVEARGGKVLEQQVWVDQDHRPTNMLSLTHFLRHGHDPMTGPMHRILKPFGVGEQGLIKARAYGYELAGRLASVDNKTPR